MELLIINQMVFYVVHFLIVIFLSVKLGMEKKKVLPGIEPGFRDSESPVITVTLQDLVASLCTWPGADATRRAH